MHEIKCPNCGKVFYVDESGYAAIVSQIRDKEFHKELSEREQQYQAEKETALKLAEANAEQEIEKTSSELKQEIERLKAQIVSDEKDKTIAVNEAMSAKKDELVQKEKLLSELQNKLKESEKDSQLKKQQYQAEKEAALKLAEANAEKEKEKLSSELKQEIERLKAQLAADEKDRTIAVNEAVSAKKDELVEKDKLLSELQSKLKESEKDSQLREQSLKENFNIQIKAKDEAIDFYKNLKTSMSTKMIGETLEQHCEIEFNKLRATGFQNAYFEKDNDAKTGSKGDYIFRECTPDGVEFISIMFEMKNEMDTTSTKKKNEDFFKELDKDRKEKNCEYAVLVSLLESDSELYNSGIVDISHKYPKMYVIRPQFFISMITVLRNAAMNSIQYRQQLAEIKNQNIDISHFEERNE